MAKDDYFVIVYKVLAYLYTQLKNGEPVDTDKLTAKWIDIPETYWEYILDSLATQGYVLNSALEETMYGKEPSEDICISPAGIAFLHENSTIAKVKNAVKGISDLVGNISAL